MSLQASFTNELAVVLATVTKELAMMPASFTNELAMMPASCYDASSFSRDLTIRLKAVIDTSVGAIGCKL